MRLPRPYIPQDIRLSVVLRQLGYLQDAITASVAAAQKAGDLRRLTYDSLCLLADQIGCAVEVLQLDHDPALENRRQMFNHLGDFIDYDPPANNPDYLVYREKHAHKIKTLVRGDGAQYSDAALARKNKRIKKNRSDRPVRKIQSRNQWGR